MLERRAARRGFTLIELLVAVAAISILIALLLPAVQQARAAARSVQCRNHLRQLALALHNYHDVHRTLPPGSYALSSVPGQHGWGWGAMVLPYLEQASLFEAIDFGSATAAYTNADAIDDTLAQWICPADIAPETILVHHPDEIAVAPDGSVTVVPSLEPPVRVAAGNYVGVEGVLSAMSRVPFEKISDGLSQTLMLGERVYQRSGETEFSSCWCGQITWNDLHVSNCIPHLAAVADHPLNFSFQAPQYFSSRHDGGVYFALADGSVHFLNESIDGQLLEALGTPNGREKTKLDLN